MEYGRPDSEQRDGDQNARVALHQRTRVVAVNSTLTIKAVCPAPGGAREVFEGGTTSVPQEVKLTRKPFGYFIRAARRGTGNLVLCCICLSSTRYFALKED